MWQVLFRKIISARSARCMDLTECHCASDAAETFAYFLCIHRSVVNLESTTMACHLWQSVIEHEPQTEGWSQRSPLSHPRTLKRGLFSIFKGVMRHNFMKIWTIESVSLRDICQPAPFIPSASRATSTWVKMRISGNWIKRILKIRKCER